MSICLDIEASNGTCTTTKCSSGAPEIRFPFEKGGQLPQHCDHPGYLLDFKNNTTIIHFPSYGHLVVKSISYDIEKLNLVDPKNCIHEVFLNLNLSLTPFQYYYAVKEHTYLNCSVTLSPSHSEIPCLSGPGYHVYAVDPSLAAPDACRVVKTVDIPLEYSHYLSDNSFGLELTWGVVGQEYCEAIEGECSLQPETEQETECLNMVTHEKDGGCRILPSTTIQRRIIEWDQGWNYMEKGIAKLKSIIEGLPETQFSSEEYMMLYTTIYNMCTQDPPYDYSQQLYDKFRETFEEYITSTVLPSLRDKQDEILLQEFAKSWENHKVMVRWLSRFFHYLDRYFISQKSLPPMNEVGHNCFRDLVYREISVKARVIVIGLINKEREGEQMDRTLLKNAINIYVEIGMGKMDAYEEDFEAHMLTSTGEYYSRKAASWIVENFCQEYMSKADECLIKEKARVSDYLHSSSEEKLVQKVEHELLVVYANQLTEKEGCRKPVSAEGSILVQLAEDVA